LFSFILPYKMCWKYRLPNMYNQYKHFLAI
jgi:hypothetical protein